MMRLLNSSSLASSRILLSCLETFLHTPLRGFLPVLDGFPCSDRLVKLGLTLSPLYQRRYEFMSPLFKADATVWLQIFKDL